MAGFITVIVVFINMRTEKADVSSLQYLSEFTFFASSVLAVASVMAFFYVRQRMPYSSPRVVVVKGCARETSRSLDHFVAVVLPLACVGDVGAPSTCALYWLSTGLVFALILAGGAYWQNPVLVLLGFHMYDVSYEVPEVKIEGSLHAICREHIKEGQSLELLSVDEDVSIAFVEGRR